MCNQIYSPQLQSYSSQLNKHRSIAFHSAHLLLIHYFCTPDLKINSFIHHTFFSSHICFITHSFITHSLHRTFFSSHIHFITHLLHHTFKSIHFYIFNPFFHSSSFSLLAHRICEIINNYNSSGVESWHFTFHSSWAPKIQSISNFHQVFKFIHLSQLSFIILPFIALPFITHSKAHHTFKCSSHIQIFITHSNVHHTFKFSSHHPIKKLNNCQFVEIPGVGAPRVRVVRASADRRRTSVSGLGIAKGKSGTLVEETLSEADHQHFECF